MCAMPKKVAKKAATPHRVAVVQHPPGQYVLSAGVGYAGVTVQPGDDLSVDIPNLCI
jgi:hypothetical protein